MPSNPTLQLRPCTSADIPALAILRHACFTAPSNKVRVQRRSPLRQTQIPSKTAFVRNLSSPRCVNFLGVVDTTTNEIISQPHLDLPAKRATSLPKTPMSSTRSCLQAPNETLTPRRKEPHWLLSYLETYPKYEGRGAGSMLIEQGFPKGRRDGAGTCFVDASTIGRPVYRKRGFEECAGASEMDLSRYEGGEGYEVQRWVAMMREPRVGESKGKIWV